MRELLNPLVKDSQRLFGALERELIYYRDEKRCAVCRAQVVWSEVDIHHIEEHAQGGRTTLENGALVHRHCHPKGATAREFAKLWRERKKSRNGSTDPNQGNLNGDDEADDTILE